MYPKCCFTIGPTLRACCATCRFLARICANFAAFLKGLQEHAESVVALQLGGEQGQPIVLMFFYVVVVHSTGTVQWSRELRYAEPLASVQGCSARPLLPMRNRSISVV